MITIGITSYNCEDHIKRAIDSALAQTYRPIEIIIVDDHSTDETWNTLRDIQSIHADIRIVQNEKNMGVAASRNRIIAEASGDFIAFFDDDDISAPERLERQYQRITRYERAHENGMPAICYTARQQHYPDGASRIEPTMGCDIDSVAPNGISVAKRILTGRPMANGFGSMATCSQMARTQTYRDLSGFDETFRRCEDTEFNVRAALAGAHFAGIDTPLVTQTMTYGSEKNITAEWDAYSAVLEKHKDFIDTYTSYVFHRKFLKAKYTYLSGQKLSCAILLCTLGLRYPVLLFKRIIWAMPNRTYHKQAQKFYGGDHG